MSIVVIVGIFVVLYGFSYVLGRNPDWRAARILFSYRGPLPKHGETFVHFTLRRVGFSAVIAIGFGVILAFLEFIDIPGYVSPYYLEQGTLLFCGFGLLLSTLIAAGLLLKALWHVLFVRKYEFDGASGLFIDAP